MLISVRAERLSVGHTVVAHRIEVRKTVLLIIVAIVVLLLHVAVYRAVVVHAHRTALVEGEEVPVHQEVEIVVVEEDK